MSGAISGVTKVFKKVAPIAIPAALSFATGGIGGMGAAGATSGGGGLFSGISSMFGGGGGFSPMSLIKSGAGLISGSMGGSEQPSRGVGAYPGESGVNSSGEYPFYGGGDIYGPSAGDSNSGFYGEIAQPPATPTGTFDKLTQWIADNPDTTKLLGDGLAGLAGGYAEGQRMDERLEAEERARVAAEKRRYWPGAFYGRDDPGYKPWEDS